MVRVVCAFALLLWVCAPAQAEDNGGGRKWLRRATMAAACAASFWDIQTTRTAVRHGAYEANRLFADAGGNPRWGRMIGFKAGLCAGSVVAQELFARRKGPEAPWIVLNSGLAAYYTGVSLHNRGLTKELERRRGPAYLLRPDL